AKHNRTYYPPVANAGDAVILYLPNNNVTLNGTASSDDHEIVAWECTKDAGDESKAVDMQNTRTLYVQIINLQINWIVLNGSSRNKEPRNEVIAENEGHESAMASARDEREEKLLVFWLHVMSMLTNLGLQMLKLFATNGSDVEFTQDYLKVFLQRKVRVGQMKT
uniref:Uncharacterized protein n=1 Tax=Glossina palpalis gambiensis TaxID=67801 RepID=A0A1B0BJ86_9MUSC